MASCRSRCPSRRACGSRWRSRRTRASRSPSISPRSASRCPTTAGSRSRSIRSRSIASRAGSTSSPTSCPLPIGSPLMSSAEIAIYDTTLRDGAQREGISLAVTDKLRIAEQLDALGGAFVEGGWPGSNPKDAELFRRALDIKWRHTTLTAFGATRKAGIGPEDDANLSALLDSGARACTIFGKTSLNHVQQVLRTTPDENLAMIEDSVKFLVSEGRRVIYDAEHFFDGAREDLAYAIATLEAAERGGAEAIVLCDTNG